MSIEMENIVVDLFFTITCTVFDVHFQRSFLENHAEGRGREKNYVIFTSFPWSILARTIALDQLARERSLCCCKTFISILLQKVTLLILCFPDPNYAVVDAASTTA